MTLEKTVEKALVKEAKDRGVLCLKLAPAGLAGFPDRTLLADGRVYFVECKRPNGGRLSRLQEFWLDRLTQHGFQVAVVKTADDARALVKRFDQCAK